MLALDQCHTGGGRNPTGPQVSDAGSRIAIFVIGVAFRILSHFGCAMLGLIVIIKGFLAFQRSIRLAQTADPWYPSVISATADSLSDSLNVLQAELSATADSLSDSLNVLQAERTLDVGEAPHRRGIMLARFLLDAHAHRAAPRS